MIISLDDSLLLVLSVSRDPAQIRSLVIGLSLLLLMLMLLARAKELFPLASLQSQVQLVIEAICNSLLVLRLHLYSGDSDVRSMDALPRRASSHPFSYLCFEKLSDPLYLLLSFLSHPNFICLFPSPSIIS